MTRDQIADAFSPFVLREVEDSDPEWREHLRRRKKKILVKGVARIATSWLPTGRRNEEEILAEYSEAWGKADYTRYDIDKPAPRYSPWEWLGRHILANTLGSTRFRQLMLIRLMERLKPKRVLEVGCGDGINLLLLAAQFPEVEFHGVELTEAGHLRAKKLQEIAELPANMQAFAPVPMKDPGAHKNIHFHRGCATDLKFQDSSMDLVITILALEQMEGIRQLALDEIARVTSGHTFMIEPFREVNSRGWRRWNVIRRDYFRGSVSELPRSGLDLVWATSDFPQENFLGAVAVLSEKAWSRGPQFLSSDDGEWAERVPFSAPRIPVIPTSRPRRGPFQGRPIERGAQLPRKR